MLREGRTIKNKLFQKYYLNSILSNMGDSIYYIVLLTYASGLTDAAIAISLVSLSETIPPLLQLITGSVADNTKDKRDKIVLCAFLRGGLYLLVSLLLLRKGSLTILAAIACINLISDIVGKYSNGLTFPFVKFMVGEDELDEVQGIFGGTQQIVSIVANFLGALLLTWFSFSLLGVFNSLIFIAVGCIYLSMKQGLGAIEETHLQVETEVNVKNVLTKMKDSLRLLIKQKDFFLVVLQLACINASLVLIIPVSTIFIKNNPQLILSTISFSIAFLQGTISVGMIIGSLFLVKRVRKLDIKLFVFSGFISSLVICVGLFFKIWALIAIGGLFVGISVDISSPKMTVLMLNSLPTKDIATISGGVNSILVVGSLLASIILTAVSAGSNYMYSFYFLFGLVLLGLLFCGLTNRKSSVEKV